MSENLAPLGLFFKAMAEDKSCGIAVGHAVDNNYEWFELKASNNLAELEKDDGKYTFTFNGDKQLIDADCFEALAQKFRQKKC